MKHLRPVHLIIALLLILALPMRSIDDSRYLNRLTRNARLSESYGRLPLSFEANHGQAPGEVKFLSRGSGYGLSLTATGAVLAMNRRNPSVVRMTLIGADPAAPVSGREELPGRSNYFIGNDPEKWRTNVPHFARVEYERVWPGIDLVYYGNQGQLEYDFIVAPGTNPETIGFTFDGADKVDLDAEGNLILHLADGDIALKKPFVYQSVNGAQREIVGSYEIRQPQRTGVNPVVGFDLGEYDAGKPLVIDPVLSYSTYLGGGNSEEARDIAVDSAGNAYVTGWTFSNNFPTASPAQGTGTGWDIFVTKLNPTGSALVYSTYLGGNDATPTNLSPEYGYGIAVDSQGSAYVTGRVQSLNFPTTAGAYNRACTFPTGGVCDDAFVTKLNPAGNGLAYSTYLGGSNPEEGNSIAVDAQGSAYVTGSTSSSNFPVTPGAFDASFNGRNDYFVTKLNPAGSALVYSTYLGGTLDEPGDSDIVVDAQGSAYVTGTTESVNYPTTQGAFDTSCGTDGQCNPLGSNSLSDIVVTKLNAAGSGLAYSTFLGGRGVDRGRAIDVDTAGHAYVTGDGTPVDFPTTQGALRTTSATIDGFVAKFNPAGSGLVYSTFLTGDNILSTYDLAVDSAGNAHLTGITVGNLPVINPIQGVYGGVFDAIVMKLNATGSALIYSTYLGGGGSDYGYGIAVDAAGAAYVTGTTGSTNFPTMSPLQAARNAGDDVFITKIQDSAPLPPHIALDKTKLDIDGETGGDNPPEQTVTLTNTGGSTLNWQANVTTTKGGDWLSVNPASRSLAPNESVTLSVTVNDFALPPETYQGTISISAPNADNSPQSIAVTLEVFCQSSFQGTSGIRQDKCTNVLNLAQEMPPANSIVTKTQLTANGLTAQVFYELLTRSQANLVMSIYDQSGGLRGQSIPIRILKPETPRPSGDPIPSVLVTIPGNRAQDPQDMGRLIDIDPINGVEVTTLTMSAKLLDIDTGNLIKESNQVLYFVNDAIAIELPRINNQIALEGSEFPNDGKVNFKCDIKYQLSTKSSGFIKLLAFNGDDGSPLGESQGVAVTKMPRDQTLNDVALSFQAPSDASRISILAVLYDTTQVNSLKTSTPINYRRSGLRIELGNATVPGFTPLPPPYIFKTFELLGKPRDGDLAIRLTYDLTSPNGQINLFISEAEENLTVLGRPELIAQKKGLPMGQQQSLVVKLPRRLTPSDVDIFIYSAELLSETGSKLADSENIIATNFRVHINNFEFIPIGQTPAPRLDPKSADLILSNAGKYQSVFEVEYSTGGLQIMSELIGAISQSDDEGHEIRATSDRKDVQQPSGKLTHTDIPLTLNLHPDANRVGVSFLLKGDNSELIALSQFLKFLVEERKDIPQGASQTNIQRGKLNSNSNSPRSVNQSTVDKKIDKIQEGIDDFLKGLNSFGSVRTAPSDELLRDFIGISSYWQFDPSIPPNSGFTADLTLEYAVGLLPDDPNFNEANLKILSYDPTTGRLEVLPTTLDLVGKKATAHINGLAPYYTLGVVGPFAQRTLNFNLLGSAADLISRLVFLNFGDSAATLVSTNYDATGSINHGPATGIPLPTLLPRNEQITRPVNDLFNLTSEINRGWMQTSADNHQIIGYQIIGQGNRVDGLDILNFYPARTVLPEIIVDSTRTTEVHIANVSNFESTLKLYLYSSSGTQIGTHQTDLPPKGKIASDIRNLFPNLLTSFNGYLVVRGDQELSAAELIISDTEIAALNGKTLSSVNRQSSLYGPAVRADGINSTTRLNLVNPTERAAVLVLKLKSATGGDFAPPVNLALAAGQQSQREIRELFGLSASATINASLVVESNVTGIVGNLTYLNPTGATAFRAALLLTSTREDAFAFAHLDNRSGNFTRLAALNSNPQAANITVKVHRADGSLVGQANAQIPADGAYSTLLADLVPASAGQEGGYFTLTSNQFISAGATFGTTSGSTLSALPAQVIEESGVVVPHVVATTDTVLTIPISVGDLSGRGIIAYDFDVVYDPAVLTPQSPAFASAGTLSSGFSVSANVATPGRLRVSAFGSTPLAGAGTLLNLKFNVTGAAGSGASLALDRFFLNDDPETALVRGSVTVARSAATVSAASYAPTSVAGESIAAVFGSSLATGIKVAETLPLPTELAGTIVKIKDSAGIERLAPLFFVSDGQINFQIPPGTINGPATVTVRSGNGALSIGTIQIARTAPGLFAANSDGQGLAAAQIFRLKANGAQSFEPIARFDAALGRFVPIPIDLGPESDQVFLVLFGTGIRHRGDISGVSATIGGAAASVLFAGPQGGFVGLDQVNLPLSRSLIGRGEVVVTLSVDGTMANSVRVTMK